MTPIGRGVCGFVCVVFLCSCLAKEDAKILEELLILKQDGETLTYQVEVADSVALRRKGLMHRRILALDHGMLLAYPESRKVAIWMKNTHIPLDIIYLDEQGRITQIRADAVPHSLSSMPSHDKVLAVLELNAGEAARQSINVGDKVVHPFFNK